MREIAFHRRAPRPAMKLAALMIAIALSAVASAKTEMAPGPISLAGQLLVASPEIGDPRFEHTVVLLLQHGQDGAMGIVINRPIEERPLASVLEAIGEDAKGVEGSVLLFAGGPVQPGRGFILHSADYRRPETLEIGEGLAMTASRDILRDIGHQKGPAKALIAFGYCGWGPGQLESEFAQHGWFTAPADPQLVFDEDRATVWQEAMRRRTRAL
jgi:putative transcriptional regulator